MTSEKQLLQRVRKLEQHALAEIYDRYSPSLYRYSFRLLGDSVIAEDCVAEAFSRFLKAIKVGGGPKTHLQAYLFRIVHNWITDYHRRLKTLPVELDDGFHTDSSLTSNAATSDVLLKEQIRKALMKLTNDQRQVIVLKFLEGWSNAEIADMMKKSVGSVKSLQHRALASLNGLLINSYGDCDD